MRERIQIPRLKIPAIRVSLLVALWIIYSAASPGQNNMIVFQSDFGLKDGAAAAMKGVAMGVSSDLRLFDLTHEIPPYNVWEAAVRLQQTVPFWPEGTVFVSVVDPGVGTDRKAVVAKTKTGQLIVTPDNGTLTLIAESPGIEMIRRIDEKVNRGQDSKDSYTFEGRDVFAYTAARLASGIITFRETGPVLIADPVMLPYRRAERIGGKLNGNIYILDIEYGNLWTNIGADLFNRIGPRFDDILHVTVSHLDKVVYEGDIPYCRTFGDVENGKPLAYLNSLMQLSFALNQDSFSKTYGIGSGGEWSVEVTIKTDNR